MRSLNLEELTALLGEWGEPKFRAAQLFQWLQSGTASYEEMTNLPKSLREKLEAYKPIDVLTELDRRVSPDGTEKILWRLPDGETVESVVMTYSYGKTVCVSTQAGCRQGCAFCASQRTGFARNLTAGEILGQVFQSGRDISRVVLMGVGEPLDNFDNVCRFIELVSHEKGLNLSRRHISLSTCGLREGIDKLAEKGYPVTLSISLHAADDETRSKLMPINNKTPVAELLAACERYFEKSGRRISYEVLLIDGVNDTDKHAELLVEMLRGKGAHVNLIPWNPVAGSAFNPTPPGRVKQFAEKLLAAGLQATVRRKLGQEIDAACGQLRRNVQPLTNGKR